jgi:trimethylamine--corrinoid protein Co-methyltransferase
MSAMNSRIQQFTREELDRVHDATLKIWDEIGVAFKEPETLEIFKSHGVRIDGEVVHIDPKSFDKAMASVPSEFVLHARDPEKSVTIGGNHIALVPGYGCPFIITAEGEKKRPTVSDYEDLCKLVQSSQVVNVCGQLMVDPSDVPANESHLHMLLANIRLCDKPFVGSAVSRQAAIDSHEMAAIAWGGGEQLKDKPVMVSIISSLSPLRYSAEMAGALIEYAKNGQVNMIGGLMMAGSTGPVRLPGLIALQNAEFLAGIVLTQLIRPGAPVIYGGTSSITDMRKGALSIGAPELSIIQNAQAQLARYYNIPCRGSGGISDALVPDAQAALESAIALNTTLCSGSHFILHACGILGAYIGMSYEKFLIDEEICAMLLRIYEPMKINSETIDLNTIKAVGIGGEYITHPTTFKHCRTEFFAPELCQRLDHAGWTSGGKKWMHEVAAQRLRQRLESFQKPAIDPGIESKLFQYVEKQKS